MNPCAYAPTVAYTLASMRGEEVNCKHLLVKGLALPSANLVLQVAQSQQSIRVAQTTPGQAGPASLGKISSIATASAAHRHAPSEAYELEDLDEDWVAMLNMLDSRLLEVGHEPLQSFHNIGMWHAYSQHVDNGQKTLIQIR